ncbi:nesprin-1-like [Protopterus annectens]|uniref:nesprin-1-like n=1 Tax=Protopterus annectens TaxID=7888 RepID=UPI001CFC1FB1|nr:nesprin-1-like [Protopterus annectens]
MPRNPPMVVDDLFEDIKDGIKLLALLEVLSGQRLRWEQGRNLRRIHCIANIGAALKFLEGRRSVYRGSPIKLVNINSTDIADGRPSIVLGLIWTIILYFQIEELTSNLPVLQSLSSSTSSVDSLAGSEATSPPSKRKIVTKGSAKKALLKWVQYTAAKCAGIEVRDFGPSWRSGIAFLSVIHAIRPDLIDLEKAKGRSNRENLEEAFAIAETQLGIPRLLDPEDVDVDKPDEKSIMTYVAQFIKHYPDPNNAETDGIENEKEDRLLLRERKAWLEQFERDLTRAQMVDASLQERYQLFKNCRVQYEMKRKQIEAVIRPLKKGGKLSVDQVMVKQVWDRVSTRLLDWHLQLDKSLPAPLNTIGSWLHRAEAILGEEITIHQAHEETANIIHRKLEQHKEILKNLESYKQTFHQIHRVGSVNGVPIPQEQLTDMAERFNVIAPASQTHLIKLEFLELKYRLLSLLMVAESKLKSWIIKYGRRDSVELLLQNYISFIDGNKFFEVYEVTYQTLKQTATTYLKMDNSAEEGENVSKLLNDSAAQWRNLSVEVRSVRSMLEEVITNWDKYSSTVSSLQAWLEDAEKMLNQSEQAKKEFFRNLPNWIQQHTTMNDAGNFLIETCDETVSRELKQQLLLLNGRWRELFVKVKHYARMDVVDEKKKDYLNGVAALTTFADTAVEKLTAPLEVSFLNIKMIVQDIEDIKQRCPAMEARFRFITRTAQTLTKDMPQEEANQMLAAMTGIKEQLSKVKELYPPVLRETQQLLTPLQEMEKQITVVHELLEKSNQITGSSPPENQPLEDFKEKQKELLDYQGQCKKAVISIEKNNQAVQRLLTSSKMLKHLDRSVLQKKVMEIQVSIENMVKQAGEWRKQIEANSSLMKRFEDSKRELEKAIEIAQSCLKEKGNPEEMLKKHTDFFGQLDQRVLNSFLKACDEMTDILPEQEQQSLQDTVRKLHKQWKDLQAEAPYHLLRLKIELEKSRLSASVEDCNSELARETRVLITTGSEQLIKEHRIFFGEKGLYLLCEKRLMLIEELCLKLPQRDPVRTTMESCRKTLKELKAQIDSTYQKLINHPDKWKEYKDRFSEVSSWLLAKEKLLKRIKIDAKEPAKYVHLRTSLEEIRQDVNKWEGTINWLKSRLATLVEISSEKDAKKEDQELSKLSSVFRDFLSLLAQTEKLLSALGECVQYKEEVSSTLDELINSQKEMQAETDKILESTSFHEAQQLLLLHQQRLKRLQSRRHDFQQQVVRGKQLQAEGTLTASVQDDLRKLEAMLSNMEETMEKQDKHLQVVLTSWEQFDVEKNSVTVFLNRASSSFGQLQNIGSLGSLSAEILQVKELLTQNKDVKEKSQNLVKMSSEIQLGPKNKKLLQQQASSIKEEVAEMGQKLAENIKEMELVKSKWEQFGSNLESLSSWITEKDKELDAMDRSPSPLEMQISHLQGFLKEVSENASRIPNLEQEAQALNKNIASGEAARIKARMTQTTRSWEELRQHLHRLEETVKENMSQQQKFDNSLTQIEQNFAGIEDRLTAPISSCNSASTTYQALQEHVNLCESLEQMKSNIASMLVSAQKVPNKEKAIQDATALQQRYEKGQQLAKQRQTQLGDLLSTWQRFEKDLSSFTSWLEKCESLATPKEQYISADQLKLQNELQCLKDLQAEVDSHETVYYHVLKLSEMIFPTANKDSTDVIQQTLKQLESRLHLLPEAITNRVSFLQSVITDHHKLEEQVLKVSNWVEQLLHDIQTTSEVNTSDLTSTSRHLKEHKVAIERQQVENQTLKASVDKMCSFCKPEDHHLLHSKIDNCIQLFQDSSQVISRREEALEQVEVFLAIQRAAAVVLQRISQTVRTEGSWDKVKGESLEKELDGVIPEIKKLESVAITLDGTLNKAQYHLKDGSSGQNSSCRAVSDKIVEELQSVQNLLGKKQSEAEALLTLWNSFIECKEQLLKNIDEIEEKADKEGLKELTLQGLQQRQRAFNLLENELSLHQHERQWLMDKVKQLSQKDVTLAAKSAKEMSLLTDTWDETKKLIDENLEHCCLLIDTMREYQNLKSTVTEVIENAENISIIKCSLKDKEEIGRILQKHEAVKNEMANSQEQLDDLTSKGKKLLAELKRITCCVPLAVKHDMDTIVDQWLDVSERIDENIERLRSSLCIWNEIVSIGDEIDGWASSSSAELSENISHLNNSQRVEARLEAFQVEVKTKDEKLEELHCKVSELKKLTRSQDVPTELQVLEGDLRKKLENVHEVSERARGTLQDFYTEKKQLETFIDKMTNWLNEVEDLICACTDSTDPEDLNKVKELQKELYSQQSSIDTTRENLNGLCRKYHSVELEALGVVITELIKKYEAVNQICSKTQADLQDSLKKRFTDALQEFQTWFADMKMKVKECSDRSGDILVLQAKLKQFEARLNCFFLNWVKNNDIVHNFCLIQIQILIWRIDS